MRRLKNENGLDFTPEQIVVSNGAKQSICNTILALVNPGDEVILPAPYWVSYVEMVKLAEGKNVIVETGIEQDFKMTPAQLEAAITPKTKLCSFSVRPPTLPAVSIPVKSWKRWPPFWNATRRYSSFPMKYTNTSIMWEPIKVWRNSPLFESG